MHRLVGLDRLIDCCFFRDISNRDMGLVPLEHFSVAAVLIIAINVNAM
jgi:hypothetical protein